MRVHIHNPLDDPHFVFTDRQWEAAARRAGDIGAGHRLSIGDGDDDLASAMREAEALVTDPATLRRLLPLPPAPRLELVFVSAAGLDALAPFDWLPPNVALLNNRGVHGDKAGEFAIMAVLMLASAMPAILTAQRAGRWEKHWGRVIGGRRISIVGLGTLGGAAAMLAARFEMHVTGVRRHARPHPHCASVIGYDDLDTVLPHTEFLLLACPLTDTTRGLLDRRRLGLLPRGAGVVNIGRGALLDQDALCDLLDDGHLAGAVLDVFAEEPVPPGDRLWTTPNLVISPHTSADDPDTYNDRSLDLFFSNLRARRDGVAMPNRFDTTRGY